MRRRHRYDKVVMFVMDNNSDQVAQTSKRIDPDPSQCRIYQLSTVHIQFFFDLSNSNTVVTTISAVINSKSVCVQML